MNHPQTFGRKVKEAQDRLVDRARIVKEAESLLFDGQASPSTAWAKPKTDRWKIAVAVGGIAAAASLALFLIMPERFTPLGAPTPALSITVDGQPLDSNAQRPIQGQKTKETALAFSDGSAIRLEKEARTRFIEVTSKGASVLLEQGRLVANIAHLKGTDWRFFAGPFEVRVTGTAFTLSWDQTGQDFSVVMESGSVAISGPSSDEPRLVRAGETFRANLPKHQMEIVANPNPKEGAEDEPKASPEESTEAVDEASQASLGFVDGPAAKPSAKNTSLSIAAMSSKTASTDSPRDACVGQSPAVLLEQADAARLLGEVTQASEAYLKIRRCFPKSGAAVLSAFHLGRIAFDSRRDWEGAVRWLKQYLKEQRGEGPVREAVGRLLEALVNGRKFQEARSVARRYLAEYPKGPHAAYATSLLEEETDSTAVP